MSGYEYYPNPALEPVYFPTFDPSPDQQSLTTYQSPTLYTVSPTLQPSPSFSADLSSFPNVYFPYGFVYPTYPFTPQAVFPSQSPQSSYCSGPPTASPALIFGQPDPLLLEQETSYFDPHPSFPTNTIHIETEQTSPAPSAEPITPSEIASPRPAAVSKKRTRTAQACEKCRIRKAKCSGNSPCTRCVIKKLPCIYADEARHRKAVKTAKHTGKVERPSTTLRRDSENTSSSTSALGLDLGLDTFGTGSGACVDEFPGHYFFIPNYETNEQW